MGMWSSLRTARARARERREEERDGALKQMMDRGRRARERRLEAVKAQEGEPILKTVLRVLYLSACVVFDGVVLLEVVRVVPGAVGWLAFASLLVIAIAVEARIYRRWFDPRQSPRPLVSRA